MVNDKDIASILRREFDSQVVCEELVKAANGAGGYDNITVMTVIWNGYS
jgi:serine/threonine protein phosphatase PrpC